MNKKQKKLLYRIIAAVVLVIVLELLLFLVHVLASGALYLCLRKRSRSRPQRACNF